MTPEQQKALALAAARRRRAEAEGQQNDGTVGPTMARGGTSLIKEKADKIEALRQPGAFGDATDSILTGIPFGDEITAGMLALPNAAISAVQGKGFDVGKEYNDAVELERELQRRRDERSPVASTVGSVAGGMALAAPAAKAGFSFLNGAKATLPSMAGRGAAEGAAYGALYGAGEGEGINDRLWRMATGAGAGAAIGGTVGGLARIGTGGAVDKSSAPSVDAIKNQAKALYGKADANGIIAAKPQLQQLATDFRTIAANEGLISPTGRISEAYPKAREALRMIDDYAQGTMNVKQMQTVRKTLADAAQGTDGGERRIAKIMRDKFDDFVEPLAPELSEARGLIAKTKRQEQIAKALYGADLNAAASGSGANIDNASRQRIARILLDPKKSRGFSSAEREAMEELVKGGSGQNLLRKIGKAAPTGIVSGGIGASTGATVGSAVGGPVGAAIGSVAIPAVGQAAKMGADALTRRQAQLVDALIRNGGKLPQKALSASRKALIEALTRSGGQSAPLSTN